jgi:antitoxin (DNA-binding transcriptional repressor) of toxin-antitoxin stability system
MYHMKTASVRDLRYRFSTVERQLRAGEEILITKRKRVIGRLLPPSPRSPVQIPDFMGRMKKIFGNKRMKVSGAKLISDERDERP